MVKRLLLLCTLLVTAFHVQAQLPPPCGSGTEPGENCEDACITCDFNGYMGSSANWAGGSVPSFCSQIQNDQWIGFIAGAASATFTVTPSNCTGGNGLQVALYGGCGENFISCNGGNQGNGNVPTVISATLVPGTNYYLLIDGYSADQCDFTITVVPANAVQAQPVGPIGAITGPSVVCPGATVTYTVPNVTNAGGYTWTVPPGATVNGEPSGSTFDAPSGRTVEVTFGATGGQVCVSAANSCFQGGQVCKNVAVVPIPPLTLPKVIICNEDAPFTLPWGQSVSVSGTYSNTYQSYQGCDSIVKQQVVIKPPIITNVSPKVVCEGNCYTVCGEQYCETGQISKLCTSYQGCDSLVLLQLTVLDPIAEIVGGGVLSCAESSIVLASEPSGANTIKLWKTITGMILAANANSITVTQPGTIILVATQQQGGVSCTKSDTIVITGNTTTPTAQAFVNGVVGCGNSVTLGVVTNAPPPPGYMWSGPGGFTSTLAAPTTTVPGSYTVTVTNQSNGCTMTSSVTVTGNTTPPTATATGGTLTCATTSVSLSSSTNASPATYAWSSVPASTIPPVQNPTVTAAGTYTVTITSGSNGCTNTASAVVTLNNTPPGVTIAAAGTISCPTPNVTITATTAAANPTYAWSSVPASTIPAVANPSVATAGVYTVTVTGGSNGCTSTSSVTVTGNTTAPNVASTGTMLNCNIPSTTISGSSSTTGATFAWTGPAPFAPSTLQNPTVSVVGNYILTVTGPNGCTASSTAVVTGDFATPNASATGAIISCASSTVTINGNSTTPGATYSWTGPGNFSSTMQNPSVNTIGDYILTVEGPNGCTTTATATVSPDANVPNASASGGTLDCNVATVTINGASTTPGVTPSWTGPNGFTSTSFTPTVSVPGTYILTISNPANGCSAQATAVIDQDIVQPGATATGGTLTCASPSFTLQGSSTASPVTYAWTGPNMFVSALQNPLATDAGTYLLTVTDPGNGCTSTATTDLLADQNAPVASATTGNLTCTTTSLTLNGSSTLTSTYAWSGPGGLSETTQNITVTLPGDYSITVTSTNGCTDAETVTVTQDITAPGAAAQGNTISCTNPQVQITATTTTGISYAWSGPSFTSTLPDPTVGTDGTYTVTVTGANGCVSTATAVVDTDTQSPTLALAAPTTLTCTVTPVDIQATITALPSTIQSLAWTGPNGFTSTLEDPSVTEPGDYVLLATSANGCTSTSTVTVLQNIVAPDLTAAGGTLTCKNTSLILDGGSTTPNAEFAWAGPNTFTAAVSDPSVSVDGVYTLTVTGANGCTSSTTATVALDTIAPGASAASSNDLDCAKLSTTLQANSPTNSVVYAWTGPAPFTSAIANPTTMVPGTYDVTITANGNGCTSSASVTVLQDIAAPNASTIGDTLDCISGVGSLQGNSTTPGVTYMWTGPGGYTSNQQNPNDPTVAGIYTLKVTGLNGCTSTTTAVIANNNNAPVVTLSNTAVLTCTNDTLTVTGTITSPTSNFSAVWSSSADATFTSTQPAIDVDAPATYTYTVTNLANGCKVTPSVVITQNIATPQAVTASNGLLNCTNPTITITGSTTTTGVTYSWTGPGGFTSTQQNPSVSTPGQYILIVTSNVNGCTDSATSTVTSDPTVPDFSVTTDTLTCTVTSVVLETVSNTPNVTFKWTGPSSFTSTLEDPTVTVPGAYTAVATAVSGCTASFTINVAQDIVKPDLKAQGDTLSCQMPTGTITATSATPNVSYSWTGPAPFTSTVANPSVTETGNYIVTVTNNNTGCTSSATVTVTPDASLPVLTTTGGTISCKVTSVTLQATSTVTVTWNWSGPGGFTSALQNPTVTVPGNYILEATAVNGCKATKTAVVAADTNGPVVNIATPNELNCTTTQVGLTATVQPSAGNYAFSWTTVDGAIVSGVNTPTPQVNAAGTYEVVVTDNGNGCSTTSSIPVLVDPATPSAAPHQTRDVKCYGDTNGSITIDSVVGGTAPFLYSLDNMPFSAASNFSSLPPGSHTIVIQDANGCEFEFEETILEPEELIVNLGQDTTIHLGEFIVLDTSDIVNIPSRVTSLVLTPAGLLDSTSTLHPFYSFIYHVTVSDANGCKASDSRTVIVDKKRNVYIPNIFDPESTTNNLFMIFGGKDVARIKSFQVFDRWGEVVHEFFNFGPNDITSAWDGRIRGKVAVPAVFVYYAEIEFIDGETILYKGDVLLKH